jgi:hypothetical protein
MEMPPKPPTAKGPAERFTGHVLLDGIVRGEEPSRVRVSAVQFTPGARTALPSHALGDPGTSPKAAAWCSPAAVSSSRSAPATSCAPGRRMALARRHARPLHDPPVHHRSHRTGRRAARDNWGEHVTDAEYGGK